MTEEFFIGQKSYGNTTRLKIFDTIFFSVSGLTPGRYPYQKLLRYDQRPSDMILWKQGNFFESKLLWVYKFILEIFFCLCEWILTWLNIDYKWGSHWLGHIKHWLESIVLLARSPPGGFGYLVRLAAAAAEQKNCFDEAENRAASSLGVGGHRHTSFKCMAKLL